jgi:hypothetical protein
MSTTKRKRRKPSDRLSQAPSSLDHSRVGGMPNPMNSAPKLAGKKPKPAMSGAKKMRKKLVKVPRKAMPMTEREQRSRNPRRKSD